MHNYTVRYWEWEWVGGREFRAYHIDEVYAERFEMESETATFFGTSNNVIAAYSNVAKVFDQEG